jgi:hypothetical protein
MMLDVGGIFDRSRFSVFMPEFAYSLSALTPE